MSLQNNAKDPTDAIFGISPDSRVINYAISTAPHLLVGGTTNSGKSVFLNQLLISMMSHNSPDDLKLAIVDPKKVEFTAYKDLPFMLTNPITDMANAEMLFNYLTILMDDLYEEFATVGVKKIAEYNEWAQQENKPKKPYIVVVVDELSDLMGQFPDVEKYLIRLGQKGRAAGIHVILATQSPRSEVVTGLIKANFPSRVSLMVANSIESMIILDETGAEKLKPYGDMLIKMNGQRAERAQGSYISNKEISDIFANLRENYDATPTDFQTLVTSSVSANAVNKEIVENVNHSEPEPHEVSDEDVADLAAQIMRGVHGGTDNDLEVNLDDEIDSSSMFAQFIEDASQAGQSTRPNQTNNQEISHNKANVGLMAMMQGYKG